MCLGGVVGAEKKKAARRPEKRGLCRSLFIAQFRVIFFLLLVADFILLPAQLIHFFTICLIDWALWSLAAARLALFQVGDDALALSALTGFS